MAGRGRPKLTEQQKINIEKINQVITAEEYMSKPRRYSNEDKVSKSGKVDVVKTQKYTTSPVVMVFKTSNRSNAQTKMKVWTTYNIDYILTAPKIPGLPEKAEILELAVGELFIEKYKTKYKIK
jgi:hypothetical protein